MRRILHVDMDAFYASVEQYDHPELQGHPVIVGADPRGGNGRGVVAACSYEARAFGVHSALPISRAWKRCPSAVYLRPRFERYSEASRAIMMIFRRYTDLVEPLSLDEAFLDVTGSAALMGSPAEIAQAIKYDIRQETGLSASVGIAPNKFLAKIASDLEKPDGLVVVPVESVAGFLRDLPIRRLWGVGPKTGQRLKALGIDTIGKLAERRRDDLIEKFGASGGHLWDLAHGNDNRDLVVEREPKSISCEHTFDRDTGDVRQLTLTLRRLSDRLGRHLRQQSYRARCVKLKLRYASFRTHLRQISVGEPIHTGNEIFHQVQRLFERFPLTERIRLLGVGACSFSKAESFDRQHLLFLESHREDRLAQALDEVHARYGHGSLQRGSEL